MEWSFLQICCHWYWYWWYHCKLRQYLLFIQWCDIVSCKNAKYAYMQKSFFIVSERIYIWCSYDDKMMSFLIEQLQTLYLALCKILTYTTVCCMVCELQILSHWLLLLRLTTTRGCLIRLPRLNTSLLSRSWPTKNKCTLFHQLWKVRNILVSSVVN